MDVLNIPMELIKRYKESKEDKLLFAFATGIKCNHRSSSLIDATPEKVMSVFGTDRKTAEMLIDKAKKSDLFVYYEKGNQLVVKSFKSEEEKTSKGRTSFKYRSDYCRKIERKPYKLKQLVKILSLTLLFNAVNAIDRDNFPQRSDNFKTRYATEKGLSVRKLAGITGMSKSAVHRHIAKLVEEGVISKTSAHAEMVIPVVNKQTATEWSSLSGGRPFIINPKDNSGWIIHPCEYSIYDRSITESFKHVIYTHKNRVETFNPSENSYDPYDNPVNAMWT